MAQTLIGVGTTANDGTGDPLRTAFQSANTNFTELYALQSQTINAGAVAYAAATTEASITLAITDAVNRGKARVFVPAAMLPYTASLVTFNTTIQMVREGASFDVFDVMAYGASGLGTAVDDTQAIAACVGAAVRQGGRVTIPSGKYKMTDEVTLGAGLTIQGENNADFVYGDPPNATLIPSFLYQATAGKAIFVMTAGMSNVRIADVAFSYALAPVANTAVADGKFGIKMTGSYPGFVWHVTFERLTFYGLHYGIYITDPAAGGGSPDWSLVPVAVTDCRFYYPFIGVYINTTNCDGWEIHRSLFNVPAGGDGIYLYRFGLGRIINSFGASSAASNNRFIRVYGNGATSIDDVTIEDCQAESIAHFLKLETGGGYGTVPLRITLRSCETELGADVYLGNQCRLISEHNRWGSTIYVDHTGVRIWAVNDQMTVSGTAYPFVFTSGDASTCFHTLLPGPDTANTYLATTYVNGQYIGRGTAAPTTGTYKLGDYQWNSAPAFGLPVLWYCSTPGSPGTWQVFGPGLHGQAAALPNVSTADATDLASVIALANSLKVNQNQLLSNRRNAGEQA